MQAFNRKLYTKIIEQTYRQYTIPVYQRSYSWKKQQCNQLYEDIIDSIKKRRNHYLGSLVYSENTEDNFSFCPIIDGQQRLTTVILLLKALYDSINEDSRIKNRIYNSLYNDNCEDRYKLKLKSIDSDNEELEKVLMGSFDDLDTDSNIAINYYNFKDRIRKSIDNGMTLEEIFEGITNLEIVEIILAEEDDAQLIFESINSTGMNLETSDLIRNFLLMGIKDSGIQKEYYKKYWVKLQNDIGKENVEKFFYDFLVMKDTRFIEESKVYENFKTYYRNINDQDFVFNEIIKYGEYYKLIICNNSKLYGKRSNELCSLFGMLKHNTINPFLLKVCYDFDEVQNLYKNVYLANQVELREKENELNNILFLFVNYAIRRAVTEVPSSSLRRFYAGLYDRVFGKNKDNKNKYYKALESYICTINTYDKMPTDIMFNDGLHYKNMYKKSRILRYFFDIIENAGKELVDMSDLTIEHILPETLSNKWKENLGLDKFQEIYDKYVHTLGNLSITGYNSEYSNYPFDDKKKMFKSFNEEGKIKIAKLNKELLDETITSWSEKEILDRADRLSKVIIEQYPYPTNIDNTLEFDKFYEFYIDNAEDDGDEYVDSPKYKLYGFSYDGVKYKCDSFKKIFIEVIKLLYTTNPTIIDGLANEKFTFENGSRIIFSHEYENDYQTEIYPNLFVMASYSRHMIFWWIRQLFDKYQLEITNFNILFTDNG